MDDMTLIQLFAQMDAHTARQEEILARMDDRRRPLAQLLERSEERDVQHTEAMQRIADNMTRITEILDRSMQRLDTQQTQLGEILGGMAAMLARMDEHTTMIAQILSQFQQGRNGHP